MPEVTILREIAPNARVAATAKVGPFCTVGPNVTIGPDTVLVRRVTVLGHTTIGSGNLIGEGCVLGAVPQDLKFEGGSTLLIIGHRNRLGRNVTAHVGTESGGWVTRVGDDNLLGDGCHVAHDCFVDDRTRLGRDTQLAGHVRVQTGAVLEDQIGAHHFTTIGRYARVGPRTPVRRDVPPYTEFYSEDYDWAPPAVHAPHEAGIRAAGLKSDEERELRRVLSELFDDETALQTKIEQVVHQGVEGEVAALCEFCQQSLQGVYGRFRELYRGKIPPEALPYLPKERRSDPRRMP
jgi:UDP-N-acetylglucosamine acyltransferase